MFSIQLQTTEASVAQSLLLTRGSLSIRSTAEAMKLQQVFLPNYILHTYIQKYLLFNYRAVSIVILHKVYGRQVFSPKQYLYSNNYVAKVLLQQPESTKRPTAHMNIDLKSKAPAFQSTASSSQGFLPKVPHI